MVLNIVTFFLLIFIGGCATTGGYERYGIYSERHDRIYEHRASFLDDGRISMAYAIVYWDILEAKEEKGEKMPEVYYIWLRNNSSLPVSIDPDKLSLITGNGETILVSRLTDSTPAPLKAQEAGPDGIVAGYAVFEIPKGTIESDRPSRLVYDDQAGNRAVRYLQIEDMKKYEGLVLEKPTYYYAPVYPRRYWYPYYYPYEYYPYNLEFYFFYTYTPHYRHYYYIPVKPERREFYVPPSPGKRGFKRSTGILGGVIDRLWGGGSTEESDKKQKGGKKREF